MAFFVVNQVIVKAINHDLITLSTWKEDWGVIGGKDDSFLSRTITRCSIIAENFCNRTFPVETIQDTVSLQRDEFSNSVLGDQNVLPLSRSPVVTINSVVENGTLLVQDTDYSLDPGPGHLFRLSNITGWRRSWVEQPIVINYSAGFNLPEHIPLVGAEDLPDDIQDAVSRLVWLKFVSRGLNPFVIKEVVAGVGGTDYAQSALIDAMPKDVYATLSNYRHTPVGY